MVRRLSCCVILVLAFVPAAVADGGGPGAGVLSGGLGVLSPNGKIRYITLANAQTTALAAVQVGDGQVLRYTTLPGLWGVPSIGSDGSTGGLSADGRTLVLGGAAPPQGPLRTVTNFTTIDTRSLSPRGTFSLPGDWAFDALSPAGAKLYLIHHVSQANAARYVVRAYDLRIGLLLPGRIADRTQPGWVMQGYAATRATSPDGRWVYTLYQNPGGYPFVHALDTVRGVAHCIGLPWQGNQSGLYNIRLSLRDGGRTLAANWRTGRPYLSVDTANWRVSQPGGSFPRWILAAALAALAAMLVSTVLAARRLRLRQDRQHEPVEGLGLAPGRGVL
ncbi:MAG: hypothetical protein ABR569_14690 [Gaiellaceae bacterium]